MDNRFIFIVQEGGAGDDSEPLIHGVFSTIELAREFCAKHPPKVRCLKFSISKFAVDHPEAWYRDVE